MNQPIRKPMRDEVNEVLEGYRGKYIHVSALLHELGSRGVYITHPTARKWIQEFGCEGKGSGLYWVPVQPESTLQEPAPAIA